MDGYGWIRGETGVEDQMGRGREARGEGGNA